MKGTNCLANNQLSLYRLYPSKVKQIIEDVITRNVKDKEYDHATAKTLAESIAD